MRNGAAKRLRAGIAAGVILAALSAVPAAAQFANAPPLTGTFSRSAGKIAGVDRSFLIYLPKNLKPGAPLLLVFHGGGQDGQDIFVSTGNGFSLLADKYGFVVVYPDGIERGWSTCRKTPIRARDRRKDVDDMAFVQAIIANQAAVNGIDKKRVFATGHSNGGAISYRLALEYPDDFAGIAVISSSLPTESEMGCEPKNKPIPVMIINGTADPVNPYRGGSSNRRNAGRDPVNGMGGMGGGMNDRMQPQMSGGMLSTLINQRGPVLSTEATAQYWATLNGQSAPPQRTKLPHLNPKDPTSVDVVSWTEPGKPPVVLYSIVNGGHLVPTPYFQHPRIVGRQTEDMNAPEVVWDFFSKLPSRP